MKLTKKVSETLHENRLRSASEIDKAAICRKEDFFTEKSLLINEAYEVSFSNSQGFPKCFCPDFAINFLPCKHMFAIFEKYADILWEHLPLWYRDSVFLTLDEDTIGRDNSANFLKYVEESFVNSNSESFVLNEKS